MEFQHRTVWVEEPARRPRMADPVRSAAVRAVIICAVALTLAQAGVLLAVGHSWLSAPVLLFAVLTAVVATWAVLDVWVTRQVWNQRGGVLSSPSSAARARRGERYGAPGDADDRYAAPGGADVRYARQETPPSGVPRARGLAGGGTSAWR